MREPIDDEKEWEPRTTFVGDTFVVRIADGSIPIRGTFKLDPSRDPKEIDYTDTHGADAGKTFLAIYSLEERLVTLTLRTQCCIAGGGPAGMMLALLLTRIGVDVVVLEKHADFLRDFGGDTVHPSTLEVLHELGLARSRTWRTARSSTSRTSTSTASTP